MIAPMGSTFGKLFRIMTWGESHGGGVGVVLEGCPPRLAISAEEIQVDLDRRKPGTTSLVSQRKETDEVQILSGLFDGRTLGTPLSLFVPNKDARSRDYEEMKHIYRPSHADYTYDAKYGIRNWKGGGRASARETVGRVAAGAIARKLLSERAGIEIVAFVTHVKDVAAGGIDRETVTRADVDASEIRCPDKAAGDRMIDLVRRVKKQGDSVGGIIECVARRVPPGLGQPVFDKLEAALAQAMLSIPATKGFEIGSGFEGTQLQGSEHNDRYVNRSGTIGTETNRSGGIQGGISNGETIYFRTAFKPTATILQKQKTVDDQGNETEVVARGRHDPCVLPRAVPIVEAMTALVLADHMLLQNAIR